ncbi:hypothetical protein TgHK011_008671 [Trichoderma gracile]|nr:hypothetical protein TgHK011_008671 [Trichoderma gracile]
MNAPPTFSFVSYDNHRVPQDPKSRTLIRRHAMRDVATTRKQKGNYRGNAIQNPESILPAEEEPIPLRGSDKPSVQASKRRSNKHKSSKKKPIVDDKQIRKHQLACLHTIFGDDLEQKMSTRFPILELIAPLTSLHLGFATISYFTSETGKTGDILYAFPLSHLQSRRLLSYLPSRYGKVSALTCTVDCLVARLDQIIRGSMTGCASQGEEDCVVFGYYAKALKEIQRAIDDEVLRTSQETLYATELLGIFELLTPQAEMNSWVYHTRGAAQLIQLRGFDRFQSDFELALFMAHIGPIVTEAFLSNKTCFLTEEPWKKVLRAAICKDPSIPWRQSELIYELWSSLIYGPNIFKTVTDMVLAPVEPPPSVIELTIRRIQRDLDHLNMWAGLLQEQQSAMEQTCLKGESQKRVIDWSFKGEYIPWQILRGTYTMCSILKRRLLTSLAPAQYPHIEEECQAMAAMAMGLGPHASNASKANGLPCGLFMAQTVWVAKAVINTKSIWCASEVAMDRAEVLGGYKRTMIDKWKFRAWCNELGRTIV